MAHNEQLTPIANVCAAFTHFTQAFITQNQPLDFLQGRTEPRDIWQYQRQKSIEARQVLLQIYNLFYPFYSNNRVDSSILVTIYMQCVMFIHEKFHTHQVTHPFRTHIE